MMVYWIVASVCSVRASSSYGVMVSTLDFESSDPGSNPGRSWFLRSFKRVLLLNWVKQGWNAQVLCEHSKDAMGRRAISAGLMV